MYFKSWYFSNVFYYSALIFQNFFKSVATIIAKRNLSWRSAVYLHHTCLGSILDVLSCPPSSGAAQQLPFLEPIWPKPTCYSWKTFSSSYLLPPKWKGSRPHIVNLKKVNVSLSKLSIICVPMVFVNIWIEKATSINFPRGKVKAQTLSEHQRNTEFRNG